MGSNTAAAVWPNAPGLQICCYLLHGLIMVSRFAAIYIMFCTWPGDLLLLGACSESGLPEPQLASPWPQVAGPTLQVPGTWPQASDPKPQIRGPRSQAPGTQVPVLVVGSSGGALTCHQQKQGYQARQRASPRVTSTA